MLVYIVLVVVVLGAVIGYWKGFIKQISSLLGLFIGYFVANKYLTQLHYFFVEKKILSENSSLWLSFIMAIILIFLSIKFLSKLIEKLLQTLGLSFTNNLLGMLLGAFKYFFILMLIFSFLQILGIITDKNTSYNLMNFIFLFRHILF